MIAAEALSRHHGEMSDEPRPSTSGYQNNRLKSHEKKKLRNSFEKERLLFDDVKREFMEFSHQDQRKQRHRKSKLNDTFFSMEDMQNDAHDSAVMTNDLSHLGLQDDSDGDIKKVMLIKIIKFC